MMTPGSRQERWILRAGVLVLIVLIWEGLCRVGLASEFWVSESRSGSFLRIGEEPTSVTVPVNFRLG